MLRRFLFIPFVCAWIGGLALWSDQSSSSQVPTTFSSATINPTSSKLSPTDLSRQELVELLDRVVGYEQYFRSVYGHYTKFLTRVGISIPRTVQDHYEIRVVEATPDHLLVSAVSEQNGRTIDLVSIDQDYRLRSNFQFPLVRPEYLKVHAIKHLRAIRSAPQPDAVDEMGVFRGYFSYTSELDSRGHRTARAEGIRAPVLGVRLELGAGDSGPKSPNTVDAEAVLERMITQGYEETLPGSLPNSVAAQATPEEVYLAQKIFKGELGRYARNWEELLMVADFQFEDKDLYGPGELPFGDISVSQEIDIARLRSPASAHAPAHLSVDSDLVVEPIGSTE